jgi:hypothetical protein
MGCACYDSESDFDEILKIAVLVQWNLDLRKPDLRKNLDLRRIVATTNFLVHKLFDLRKIF